MTITFVDDFCGAGGSSQGLKEAGLTLLQAANHSEKAIETHSANFPGADHLLTDLLTYNPRMRPRAHVHWMSPSCTWHSPAGGRKRKRAMLDMFDEHVPDDVGERSRMTMMTVVSVAEAKRPPIVFVENVVEVADWELFEVWLAGMTALGYEHQILSVSAAHVWSDGNPPAPQWRDRVYFVFYQRGIDFPDVSPRPWAACADCGRDVRAVQSWKRPGRRIGKYRQQYVYACPVPGHPVVEPYVMPALDALDLSDLGERIGDRKRPLAAATMRRIRVGALMFGGETEVVKHTGHSYDAAKSYHPRHGDMDAYYRVQPAAEPLAARTSTPGDAVVQPFTVQRRDYNGPDQSRVASVMEPMRTRTASDRGIHGLVTQPYLAEYYGNGGAQGTDEPIGTVTTREHHALVTPIGVTLRNHAHPYSTADEAVPTVAAAGNHHGIATPFLSKHHGGLDYKAIGHMNKPVTEPLPTMVSKPNVSLVTPTRRARITATPEEVDAIDISDYRFRMLRWREHATAQRFPRDYVFTGNGSENTLMAGNAVASNVAHYLGLLARVALGDTPADQLGLDWLEDAA
ncbi:DNA cytosine methyltransferase [Microbacterium sp. BG28]|uniref:DNA cytosine methyltransferase n=1 Tax=Microbacterium sp. BG28 TaxID=3097356 RepID=UPI002A5AB922|nr:DNA cytosine methyltransferase [Microbacterium sp. BG28]MDY0829090.1 DNA cytosine methyltransferase [Microbacterium sp. BG28]